ncbi:hypothetical protein DOTSEDRAFT_68316 [Dothistroma septosporum NZE10]|uniref:RRM domain-containing protein n=1 Tax=Dothistroma septosporum (strain NZE10 / CBS 128990) TaxID=675120 RepID=N1Q1E7_DOTSN|nr:hypothetical protein DOTSEDRAFT_68316 [Dothistroma septosporum NZE10]
MTQRAPFPSDPDTFDNDDRISFSKVDGRHLLEDEEGEEWEWMTGPGKWSKTMDEAAIQQQQEIYKVQGVDEDAPALNPAKKRKEAQQDDAENRSKSAKSSSSSHAGATGKATAAAAAAVKPPRQNTAVFVTGLPQDVDHEEVRDHFKKFGMISESIDDNEKRVKLYNDKGGNFKGEALIIYYRPESVKLAIDMADGAYLPRRDASAPTASISVVAADSSFKAHKDDTVAEERPKGKPKGSRAKAKQKADEMNSRLADWSDDEPSAMQQTSSRFDKVVIIKNVFTLKALEEDKDYYEDIMDDMREAGAHGDIKNITIFDKEEDGVVTIRFSNAMAAKACADTFNGRGYDGRRLEASIATGLEKFKKSRKAKTGDDEEEAKRLEDYSNFIEGKSGNGTSTGGEPS